MLQVGTPAKLEATESSNRHNTSNKKYVEILKIKLP
jgi:hypothetical protein